MSIPGSAQDHLNHTVEPRPQLAPQYTWAGQEEIGGTRRNSVPRGPHYREPVVFRRSNRVVVRGVTSNSLRSGSGCSGQHQDEHPIALGQTDIVEQVGRPWNSSSSAVGIHSAAFA